MLIISMHTSSAFGVMTASLHRDFVQIFNAMVCPKQQVYSGDVDGCVPHLGTRRWVSSLGLRPARPWRSWHSSTGPRSRHMHREQSVTWASSTESQTLGLHLVRLWRRSTACQLPTSSHPLQPTSLAGPSATLCEQSPQHSGVWCAVSALRLPGTRAGILSMAAEHEQYYFTQTLCSAVSALSNKPSSGYSQAIGCWAKAANLRLSAFLTSATVVRCAGQLAGFVEQFQGLTYATVKGAGHMVGTRFDWRTPISVRSDGQCTAL